MTEPFTDYPADSIQYAQSRVKDTGRAYLVSIGGHSMMDCRENRQNIKDATECDYALLVSKSGQREIRL